MSDRYATQNLNRTLTHFAMENMGTGGPFVADMIAPVVHVPTSTGTYYKFSNTEALRDAMSLITRKLRLPIEKRIISRVMSASYITNNGAATAAWDAESGVDIEADIDTAKLAVRKNSGMEPNTIVIPPHIAVVAKKDSEIRDLVKHTDPTLLVNGELPQKVFGLDVVIPLALADSAEAGVAAADLDFAWDANCVLVAYVERNAPSKRSLSLAYQFRRPIAGTLDIAAFRYRDDSRHATVVEGLIEQTEEVVCAACGYLITGAHS